MEQNDLLSTGENMVIPADKNIRFANFIIDTIIFYMLSMLFGVIIALVAPDFISKAADSNDAGTGIGWYIISILIYIAYFGVFEGLTKGKTIGKLITRTKAVKEDGSTISMGDAIKRAFCRIIPFEPFSAFGNTPWHDSITNTTVIKDR